MLNNLSSDELRRQLSENNAAMNTLAEDNQKIIELLASRGLQPVEPVPQSIDAAETAKPEAGEEPLTAEELRAEGWWCATAGWPEMLILMDAGMVVDSHARSLIAGPKGLASGASSEVVAHCELGRINTGYLKQVFRAGGHFYWARSQG